MAIFISSATLNRVFELLVDTAKAGERCPQMTPHGTLTREQNRAVAELARAGRVRLEIYPHNWRVIVICEGPHAGKHTKLPPPLGTNKPWKIIQKGDVSAGQRGVPSKPRLLTEVA